MATTFGIFIPGHDVVYARQAASAAFRQLDRLESELSRYVESSDIARANRLAPGETISIGEDTVNCLLVAAEVSAATQGTFDPAYATQPADGLVPDAPLYTLDPVSHALTSHVARLHLDLGAIGKGYALDRLAATLCEWGIAAALLQSGGSTALAFEAPDTEPNWLVGLGEGKSYRTMALVNAALSGSGTAVKGAHLLDPRTGQSASRQDRVWAFGPNGAVADALSTAFFVMTDSEVEAFCAKHSGIGAAFQRPDGSLSCFGAISPEREINWK